MRLEANGTIEDGQDFGYLSRFQVKLSHGLTVHVLDDADAEWLHGIAAHRKRRLFIEIENEMENFDVIAGKIADDFCIKQLLSNKLKGQYCFKIVKDL